MRSRILGDGRATVNRLGTFGANIEDLGPMEARSAPARGGRGIRELPGGARTSTRRLLASTSVSLLVGWFCLALGGCTAAPPTYATPGAPVSAAPATAAVPTQAGAAAPTQPARAVPTPTDGLVAVVPTVPKPGGAPAAGQKPPVELPRQVIIPRMDVDAGVEFVGLLPDGSMDVPKDPLRVAWYKLGPRPGEQGNAILAGHVDWGGKPAVFWGLRELNPGDVVEVIAADERRYSFKVRWLKWIEAQAAVADEVFRQAPEREITLITCGGPFDPSTRQYQSRLVVRGTMEEVP